VVESSTAYQGATPSAIRFHYDLSNDFYDLFLDPTRTYSCALWDVDDGGSDSLRAAQERKLDHIAGQARAAGCAQVVDVGCGWGSMAHRLVTTHSVGHVVGLTLSPAQADAVRATSDPRIEVRLEGWAEHEPQTSYGAVVSIGAFEHFASPGLSRADRVDGYRDFFRRCHAWLEPTGRLALQTITKGNNVRLDRSTLAELRFVMEQVFPESELPWPSEVVEASERRFELVSLRNDTAHYARTCTAWLTNLRRRRSDAVVLVGEARVADYEQYLAYCARHFERGHLALLRLTFERR
jgi:cyclopropane-fatty-acyl-phospholipid synthase